MTDSSKSSDGSGENVDNGTVGEKLTPEQDERVKDIINGDQFRRVNMADRRYLVGGAGEGDAADRRVLVYDALDDRTDAIATQLEDYGLTDDEIGLWVPVFDLLCGRCTHISMVIEDFDGGYVWESGLLYNYREKTWVLKRRYGDDERESKRYDNGMAASHIEALRGTEHLQEWSDSESLLEVTDRIP